MIRVIKRWVGCFLVVLLSALCLSAQPNLSRIEYFIDIDPGYNHATAISFTPGTSLVNFPLNINPATITPGVHILGLRARDANGVWSLDNKWLFARPYSSDSTGPGPVPNLHRVEYYLDADPGYGKATAISFTPGTSLSSIAININPSSVSPGVHILGIRSQDTKGAWSMDNKWLFARPYSSDSTGPGPVPNLNRVEYYLDADPGYGKATAISFTPGTSLSSIAININPSTLLAGVHILAIRAQDAKGAWSLDNKWLFAKPYPADSTGPGPVPNLNQVEYYFDKDPGYGKGIPVAINSVTSLPSFKLPVNIAGLSKGIHTLFIRSKNYHGAWSLDNKFNFTVSTAVAAPAIVVNSVTNKALCDKDTLRVSYQADGTFNAGNIFRVELSDLNGSFAAPKVIGSYTGTGNAIISFPVPDNLPLGTKYRVRVSSSNPAVTGLTGSDSLTVRVRPATQTITGDSTVNVTQTYPYSVPAISGSSWAWIVPAATVSQTANAANLLWNVHGQPQPIKIIQTDQYGCTSDTSKKNINVYPLQIDSIKVSSLSACPGSSPVVTAKVYGIYNAGNVFTAQLSNATGSFSSPLSIGKVTASPMGNDQLVTIDATIPGSLANGTGYRMRVISSSPAVTSADNGQNIAISLQPAPGAISGTAFDLCSGGSNQYSVAAVSGATSYTWTVPAGCTISTGQGTDLIHVTIPSHFTSGTMSVVDGKGTCVSSSSSLLIYGKPDTPSAISGSTTVASKQAGLIYSVTAIAGLTYTWTVPSGTLITSGQGTNSIKVTWGTASGTITVDATNTCGASTSRSLSVTVSGAAVLSLSESSLEGNSLEGISIQLYPNPSDGISHLRFIATTEDQYLVEVTDAMGRALFVREGKSAIGENTVSLNFSSYAQGIYFVSLVEKINGRRTMKLVKLDK